MLIRFPITAQCLYFLALVLSISPIHLQASESLAPHFLNPPPEARPAVLWQWMGGLLNKEGITKDLEALSAQGFGRVMIMQMPDQCPYPRQWAYQDYSGKVKILSDQWFDMVNFAVGECDRLKMQLGIFICPGWGHVGGPWVPAEMGTKKLVFTKDHIVGPTLYDKELPKHQPHPILSGGNEVPEWNKDHGLLPKPKMNFFRDEAVLALPSEGDVLTLADIKDLSDKLDKSGRLRWDAPAGNWTIYRFSLISENGVNHPAPPESIGLESDRMDPVPVRMVFDGMVGRIHREAQAKGYQSFFAFETDSYETGFQDFGLDFREQFMKRRGYDCTLWLPAWKDKKTIESSSLSERFNADISRTISELWGERFHGALRKLADENGLEWMTEPYFMIPVDWTSLGGRCNIVGEEFWIGENGRTGAQCGNAVEIAATYGIQMVWAEAFTAEPEHSAWRNNPWILKRAGDEAFARGVNLFFIHGFVHNPFSDKYQPGLSMGYWGTQLTRHVTWWPMAGAWSKYLARCQYMNQQGRPKYDLLSYPIKIQPTPMPLRGTYRMAALTDEVLLNRLQVRDGKFVLPHGDEFMALTLSGDFLRLEALEKIRDLVLAGGTLIGNPPPPISLSLENYPACDKKMVGIIQEIWGDKSAGNVLRMNKLGKGKVVAGGSLDDAMNMLGKSPDVIFSPIQNTQVADIRSHLRTKGNYKYWFISNQEDHPVKVTASFDMAGLQPSWWDPITGTTRDLLDFRHDGNRTIVPLALSERQSGFVVFNTEKKPKAEIASSPNFPDLKIFLSIQGPWEVSFDSRWGGPDKPVVFSALSDWSKNDDDRIRYYSGTATYRTTFDEGQGGRDRSLNLDIGKVHDLARIRLNGKELGVIWCAPWQISIPAGLIKPKGNSLEISVVNTWVNRLIGDEQQPDDFLTEPGNPGNYRTGGYRAGKPARGLKELPEWLLKEQARPSTKRLTFVSWFYYDRAAPLEASGLLGPVQLMAENN